jgi:hypothetical protein
VRLPILIQQHLYFEESRATSKPSVAGGLLKASIIVKGVQRPQLASHIDREFLDGGNIVDTLH